MLMHTSYFLEIFFKSALINGLLCENDGFPDLSLLSNGRSSGTVQVIVPYQRFQWLLQGAMIDLMCKNEMYQYHKHFSPVLIEARPVDHSACNL